MASMGSFPAGVDTSILLHSSNHGRPVIPIIGYRPRKHLEVGVFSDGNYSNGFPRTSTVHHLVSKRSLQKRVKATSDGGGVDENNDEKEDALQVTIEKSKKVLAMQRDLLQQISERKKLVSSIKDSISSEESQPADVENGTSSTLDTTATDAKEDWKGIPASDAGFRQQLEASSYLNVSSKNVPLKSNNGLGQREPSLETKSFKELPKTLEPISGSKTSTETNSEQKLRKTVNPILGSKNSTEKDSEQKLKDAYTKTVVLSDIPSSRKSEGADDVKEFFAWDTNSEAQESGKEDVKSPPLAGPNVMNVILVASECAPWIKTGGLGDVAGALPKALARRGHRIMVIVPRYGDYAQAQDVGVRKRHKVDGQDFEVNYFHAYIDGVDFVFIDSPAFRHLGNNIYGGNREDVLKRMVLFCKAAVEVPWHVPCGGICYGDGNLVFIANDWHTALLPVYLKAYYRDNGLMQYTRSVLVIHNIAHQGRGPVEDFSKTDLPPHYIDLFKLYDPVGGEHFNIFAAGLKTADRIVTVSHGYAWELKTSEGGWGLHGIINENDWKFCGIVNGIDTNEWSPESDVYLQSDGYANYSIETLKPGKAQCKSALQKELGLPVREGVPLIGFIGRLDHQKGVDLIAEAVPWMMGQDVQLVMLGTGRPDLEQLLRQFEGQYNDRVRGWVGFSVKTAHRITAAADILLMPSRFEPCGLNQLYAMRYGTIPVVHAVGGLRDTVQPFNPFEETGLGWTFAKAEANELINALGNCLLTYRQYKESWAGLQRRGMMQDLSWDNAAVHYEEVLVAAKYQW